MSDRDEWAGHALEERRRFVPTLPAKISILAGLCALVGAAYFLAAPVFMETSNAWFACGSVVSGYPSEFVRNTCNGATGLNRARAIALGALALVLLVGGVLLFGGTTRVERRRAGDLKPDLDDDLDLDDDRDLHDDPDLDDRRARRGGRGDRPTQRWDDEDYDDRGDEDNRSRREERHVHDGGRRRAERDDDWDL